MVSNDWFKFIIWCFFRSRALGIWGNRQGDQARDFWTANGREETRMSINYYRNWLDFCPEKIHDFEWLGYEKFAYIGVHSRLKTHHLRFSPLAWSPWGNRQFFALDKSDHWDQIGNSMLNRGNRFSVIWAESLQNNNSWNFTSSYPFFYWVWHQVVWHRIQLKRA